MIARLFQYCVTYCEVSDDEMGGFLDWLGRAGVVDWVIGELIQFARDEMQANMQRKKGVCRISALGFSLGALIPLVCKAF